MVRPYNAFKKKWLGKRINYDNRVGYQCVDLWKQYMDEVIGIKPKASGNAKDIWKNSFKPFSSKWTKIVGTRDLMQGDIICATCGKCGHIAIVDRYEGNKIWVLEQNGSGVNSGSGTGANAIRVKDYLPVFWAGVRRSQKIFDNLQIERGYIEGQLSSKDSGIDINYQNSIRYLNK